MRNEDEITEKYKTFLIIKDSSKVTEKQREEIQTTIAVLRWVLECDICKKYPCDCYEPF